MRKTTKVKHEQKETGREACLLKQNDLCDSKGDGQHIVRRILSFELERVRGIKGDGFASHIVIFLQSIFDQLLGIVSGHFLGLVVPICQRNILRRGDLGAVLPDGLISQQVGFFAGKSILAVSGCLLLQNDEKCSLVVSSYNDSTSFKAMTHLGYLQFTR